MPRSVKDPTKLKLHPHASLIPPMTAQEYQDLLEDIRTHGIQEALAVDGNTVLDGRHRLQIAKTLRLPTVPVRPAPLNGESALTYMLRMAVLRRHLTDDQRSAMAALWKQKNGKPAGRPRKNSHNGVGVLLKVPAKEVPTIFNIPRRKLDEATYLLHHAPQKLEQVHRGNLRLKEGLRAIHLEQQHEEIQTLVVPIGKFSVITIDPPWPYQKRKNDVTKRGIIPYPAMTIAELSELAIPATDNCILWLWATNAFLWEARDLLEVWGFEPKTVLTWVKDRMGVGDWLRGQTEHCILAIKGNPPIHLTNQTTVLYAKRQKHSQKPEEFFLLVERLCPARPRLAMFFRTSRPGWKCYGT